MDFLICKKAVKLSTLCILAKYSCYLYSFKINMQGRIYFTGS